MDKHTEELCTGLVNTIKEHLHSPGFLERNRQSAKDFTRKRCLTFVVVVMFLLNFIKRALQDELDEFFKLESGEMAAVRA